ncbi:MAG: ABC transporter permease subunit [Mycoplasmoidaceae bacterium]|nr:ABC transporter permease subunit [Mycoplasmoidaceae bacterium]
MAICQTFMGMVASLFTAVLAINVFKDSNEEGTELIIISKPISRFKIVVTKFILFGFFCLLINLTTVLLSVFTIFLPRTEPQFYVGLLVSMFIGNAVTFAVFGSISILLTVRFAKVGVIVTNVVISLVFLIYQTLTLFVFSTPSIILDNNAMSASSYIIHKRDMNDLTKGGYEEDQVVKFEPAEVSLEKQHPCQATNWKEMKEF